MLNLSPLFTFLFLLIFFSSCKQDKKHLKSKIRRIVVEDVIAEGDVSSDTVYNGLIKFYDTTTKRLVIEAFYKNGKLDGKRQDYYLNGRTKNIGHYEKGKQIGTFSFFDSMGELTSKRDFYYNLKVGSNIEFKKGQLSKYYFTSFDNETLFYIDYDSIYDKEIKKINDDNFFFWHINESTEITTTDKKLERKECFIYLINPPDFNFEYSFCVINNKDSVLRTEKKFDKAKIWDTFTIDSSILARGERFTLRLSFDRRLNSEGREKGDMLKRL